MDAALAELVAQNRTYEPRGGRKAVAADGDQLLIDFVGKIDGDALRRRRRRGRWRSCSARASFIPGFEEQLVGAKAGDERTVTVNFPENYQAQQLAGQGSRPSTSPYARSARRKRRPPTTPWPSAWASPTWPRFARRCARTWTPSSSRPSRFKLKRALLDALDERHDIPLPPRMVDAEFGGIWQQVEKDAPRGRPLPRTRARPKTICAAEYRKIAERRVRLGLVLAEIGRRANIQVTEAEVSDAMRQEAMRYGEQAQQIFDMMRQNDDYRAQLQAPIYEEKVVDHILSGLASRGRAGQQGRAAEGRRPADGHGRASPRHDHDQP